MTYWRRASRIRECIQVYEDAAEARYIEGTELNRHGCRPGGAYLLGYVGELILKAAFFRNRGWADGDPITGAVRRRHLPRRAPGHDAYAWATLLIGIRNSGGNPFPTNLANDLNLHALAIKRNWSESLRYRNVEPSVAELNELTDAVYWLIENKSKLA